MHAAGFVYETDMRGTGHAQDLRPALIYGKLESQNQFVKRHGAIKVSVVKKCDA